MFTLNNNLFQKRNLKDELLINVCYVLMSVLFILRTIPYFSQAGDQTWFASQAIKYNYNYLQFGIDRYFNWSSRLLIESATMFFFSPPNFVCCFHFFTISCILESSCKYFSFG